MSREKILAQIRQNKPGFIERPASNQFAYTGQDVVAHFLQSVQTAGAQGFRVNSLQQIADKMQEIFPSLDKCINLVEGLPLAVGPSPVAADFEDLALLILPGKLAVAENAAVWLTEDLYPNRVLPFITDQLVLVVQAQTIVGNMHQAYQQIDAAGWGYGAFIAGPSKTADIEQSLVIGAHGARSATVFVLEQP